MKNKAAPSFSTIPTNSNLYIKCFLELLEQWQKNRCVVLITPFLKDVIPS